MSHYSSARRWGFLTVGARMKPMLRVHTAGSVGASTALTAVTHVASGLCDRVLTVAFEKQSEGNAMWVLSPNLPINPSGGNPIGASGMLRLGAAALQVMGRAGAHPSIRPLKPWGLQGER